MFCNKQWVNFIIKKYVFKNQHYRSNMLLTTIQFQQQYLGAKCKTVGYGISKNLICKISTFCCENVQRFTQQSKCFALAISPHCGISPGGRITPPTAWKHWTLVLSSIFIHSSLSFKKWPRKSLFFAFVISKWFLGQKWHSNTVKCDYLIRKSSVLL